MIQRLSLALLAIASFAFNAVAQEYPTRSIRLIVPYAPGGQGDTISRAYAKELTGKLNVPVVIENRPGAGTAIGTQSAKQSNADGYTLLFGSGSIITTLLSLSDPGYQLSDFTPIVNLGENLLVLAIPASLPAKNLTEFVSYIRKNAARSNYGMLGTNSPSHLLGVRLQRAAGFQWQDIAYKGFSPAMQAVMSGEVQGYFTTQGSAMALRDSDKVRIIATAGEKRSVFLPDIPTFKEAGLEGVVDSNWYSIFVRSDTPPEIIKKLRQVSAEILSEPAITQQQEKMGLTRSSQTIEKFAASLPNEQKTRAEEIRVIESLKN